MAKQNTGTYTTAGFAGVWYGVRDADGYLTGNSPTAPVGGATGSPLYRLIGAVTANIPLTEALIVNIQGDDGVITTFTFPPDALPTGNLTLASRDPVFEGISKGTKVYTNGQVVTSLNVSKGDTYQPLFLHMVRQAQTTDPNNFGNKRWENIILPNVVVQPLFNTLETRAHAPFNFRVDLRMTNALGTGETFTDASYGAVLGAMYTRFTNYPYHHMVYTGDNTTTEFNLEYTPISTAEIKVFVNGVPATVSSVNTTTKTFTLSSAPATSAIVVAYYGFPESEL